MEYWDLHPDEQTPENMLSRIIEFEMTIKTVGFSPSPPITRPAMPLLP